MKQRYPFLLFLTSIMTMQSCSIEQNQEESPITTSVVISPHSTSLYNKNVSDPFLFGKIKDITVNATQIATGYTSNTLFTISNNPTDYSTYRLDLIQEGINTFTAKATSVTQPIVPGYASVPRNPSNAGIWKTIDDQVATPAYATYSGYIGNTFVDHNIPITLYMPMSTNNGRFIAYFRGSPRPFETTVTPYIDDVMQAEFVVTSANDYYWIWNDAECIAGKRVRFHCIERNNGGNIKSTTDIPTVTIKSHTTSKYAYDIDETGDSFTNITRS